MFIYQFSIHRKNQFTGQCDPIPKQSGRHVTNLLARQTDERTKEVGKTSRIIAFSPSFHTARFNCLSVADDHKKICSFHLDEEHDYP